MHVSDQSFKKKMFPTNQDEQVMGFAPNLLNCTKITFFNHLTRPSDLMLGISLLSSKWRQGIRAFGGGTYDGPEAKARNGEDPTTCCDCSTE